MSRVCTKPLPLYKCSCGKRTWAISTKKIVNCGQCSKVMKCINYDESGNLVEYDLDSKKVNEPSGKGPLEQNNVNLFCKYKVNKSIKENLDLYNPQFKEVI